MKTVAVVYPSGKVGDVHVPPGGRFDDYDEAVASISEAIRAVENAYFTNGDRSREVLAEHTRCVTTLRDVQAELAAIRDAVRS